jgi:hypothetical protein
MNIKDANEGLTVLQESIARMIEGYEKETGLIVQNAHIRSQSYCQSFPKADRVVLTVELPKQEETRCPDCKLSNTDNHYDAENKICHVYETAISEG